MKILEIYQYFLMVGLGFTGLNLLILAINLLALCGRKEKNTDPRRKLSGSWGYGYYPPPEGPKPPPPDVEYASARRDVICPNGHGFLKPCSVNGGDFVLKCLTCGFEKLFGKGVTEALQETLDEIASEASKEAQKPKEAVQKPPFIPICPVCNGLKCSHASGVCVSSEYKKGNCVGCTERCLTCLGTGRALQAPQEGPQPQPPADTRHMGKDGESRGISEAVQRVKDDQDCVECFGTQCVDAVCLMSVRDCQKCANRCQACQGTGKAA